MKILRSPPTALPDVFAAIDFETADTLPDSACSVGLVRVERGEVVDRAYRLIRPPRREIPHSFVHGLTWSRVRRARPFGEVWPTIAPLLAGVAFVTAHNAEFDRAVLAACCEQAGLPAPEVDFVCTVELARRTWTLPSARLPAVSAFLGVPLEHHHAGSDAEACARIAVAAFRAAAAPREERSGNPAAA